MRTEKCQISGIRPATYHVTVMQDGERKKMDICEYDDARLTRQQRRASPLESLFGGGDPFKGFFDRARGMMGDAMPRPDRHDRCGQREAICGQLQRADQGHAAEGGRAHAGQRPSRHRHRTAAPCPARQRGGAGGPPRDPSATNRQQEDHGLRIAASSEVLRGDVHGHEPCWVSPPLCEEPASGPWSRRENASAFATRPNGLFWTRATN
ncbi:hypothetical protein SAMN04488021_1537 [Paracoccus aminovorans]|uniref:Uncharacterized protein n=1 Tax=Paracoccus aminovorans TaxID=34004 RepID=A0A1I3EST5_9RHOB|nr:hypothetical protein JCM7685_pAMV3p0618 [Paracoccus aminovorans]SFI01701.1 hypothetical protein SAMN04488021_1537 [Paracoccus aminovorans]